MAVASLRGIPLVSGKEAPEDARISLLTFPGWSRARSCATRPPMECPQTMASLAPTWSMMAATSSANMSVVYGMEGLPERPVPR